MQSRKSLFSRVKARVPIYKEDFSKDLSRYGFFVAIFNFLKRIFNFFRNRFNPQAARDSQYIKWMENVESKYLNEKVMISEYSKLKSKPKFSIVFPVWNPQEVFLKKALDSIINQVYENWEICISDGSSKNIEETKAFLRGYQKNYPKKIKIGTLDKQSRTKINISKNSNNAIDLATGEYIIFMDSDDEISPNCLLEITKAINKNPNAEFIYSDFDKIDEEGNRFAPSFWPDFSPHLLASQMYASHITCYRKDIIDKLGGLREGADGAQDWDLALRYMDLKDYKNFDYVIHIAKILYHWRMTETSTALAGKNAKSWAYDNQKKVIQDYLERRDFEGKVVKGIYEGSWRVRYEIKDNPKVSIAIPFKDKIELLQKVIPSIIEKTKYSNYEIVLVNNESKEDRTFEYLEEISKKENIRVINYDKPYHFGKLYNWVANEIDSEYLLMLNNDIEVLSEGWLTSMLEMCQLPEVGLVGAKLYYPDGSIQHAGIIVGLGDGAGHAYRALPGNTHGFDSPVVTIKNYISVTSACSMIKTQLFRDMGGFDEGLEPVFQDVDLGIKLYDEGYFNVYTPYAELIHYESVSRLKKNQINDEVKDRKCAAILKKKWPKYFGNDPFYNPNLSKNHEDFRIAT